MLLLVLGLLIFLGIHCVRIVAPEARLKLIAERGEGVWKGIYSVISVVGLVLIVMGYGNMREDATVLYQTPEWGRTLALSLMPLALILLMASNFPPGYIKRAVGHPMLIAVIMWAIVHLLANGDSASVLLFGALLVWAVIDLFSALRRPSVTPERIAVWPDIMALALGIFLTWLFLVWAHEWLMGVGII